MVKDISETRIPNLLILFGLISGIFYRVLCEGERNYLYILVGVLFPVLVFFPLFLFRAMGAGDIKLMAVTGMFFTIGENLKCIIIAILIGGIIALIKVLFYKELRERLHYMLSFLGNVFRYAVAGNFYGLPYVDKKDKEVKHIGIKFSLPILLSAIIVMGGKI